MADMEKLAHTGRDMGMSRLRRASEWTARGAPALIALCVLTLAAITGCAGGASPPAADWPTTAWQTSTPEEQGMDSARLAAMLREIREQAHRIDSVTVVRNGYVVLDAYVAPFRPGLKHVLYSCTKSVISALIGIAIEQGAIAGVDEPILALFPERTAAHLDADKQAATLRHLLTMSSGLACRDSYLYRWAGLNEMRRSDDWVQFMLDLPMADPPGTHFEYCNGGSFLLSAILQEATGMAALDFARENLFGPLGISDVEWPANPQGITIGYSDLRLRPLDMAKIGYLYLRQGQWEDQQVVPAAWVRDSTRQHIVARTLQEGYGYQWWVARAGYTMALGYSGQYIVVVPEHDLVVVFTSDLAEQDFYVPHQLLDDFIIPAAASSRPLSPNPGGLAELAAQIDALAGR
jgi:CubicO group peptidase (beta-lactamase class C family)